jgi:leucyl aminopeptidase (aminopeptidase T)
MPDIRLERMARVLVHYSLGLQKGDRLAIDTNPHTKW